MWKKVLYLTFLILLAIIPVSMLLIEPEQEYKELWEAEVEVADPRFLPIDKNELIDKSAFWGVSSKLKASLAKGVPEIRDSYVYHSLDWQNGNAYIVLNDANETITQFILDQFSPHVQEKIRFLKSPAPLNQINEWRETLMELCQGKLKERGVNWTSMGTYYDGRIQLDIEEITPEIINIIEEVIEGRVPLGIFVIWESGSLIELNEQDFDSIESRAENFVKNLNLSDVRYEITLESENLSEALIYFRVEGGKIPIMTISHIMEQGNILVEQWTRHGASSPSRNVEIVDFKIKEQRINNQRVFEIVNPLVMNLGNGTAYVARIKTVVRNSSHTFSRTYGTVSKGSRDGLIGQGESVWLGEVMPGLGRIQDSLGEWHRVLYDSLVGETFTITITVYDGAGTALTKTSFLHKFQAEPDP